MRILFLILAHDRPKDVAELARMLSNAGSDARTLIHFDLSASSSDFAQLEREVADDARVELVCNRVSTKWGSWGLVKAPLNSLAQAEMSLEDWGWTPDRVVLLSGACLPCRPVLQLEKFLETHSYFEFIESEDHDWIQAGLKEERHKHYFLFNYKTQHKRFRALNKIQRHLNVQRAFPADLIPRFGSQWWCLTWSTCAKIIKYFRENPEHAKFFSTVWIPDEMVFQTLAHKIVDAKNIYGQNINLFCFTENGVPITYYDDHIEDARYFDGFFFRKADPSARDLRKWAFSIAVDKTDGPLVHLGGDRKIGYQVKVHNQISRQSLGRPFDDEQLVGSIHEPLRRVEKPYIIVVGPESLTSCCIEHLAQTLPDKQFDVLGSPFEPGRIGFGPYDVEFHGLRAEDLAVRDEHPALYLSRIRARAEGVPVMVLPPSGLKWVSEAILYDDPNALIVAALPFEGDSDRDRRLLLAPQVINKAPLWQQGMQKDALRELLFAQASETDDHILEDLSRHLFGSDDDHHSLRQRTLALPFYLRPDSTEPEYLNSFRMKVRQQFIDANIFAARDWFAPLNDGLESFWSRDWSKEVEKSREEGPLACYATPLMRQLIWGEPLANEELRNSEAVHVTATS